MFDFLYSDHERVASLMSQMEGVGSLIGYERTSTKEKETHGKAAGSLAFASGEFGRSTNLNRQLRQEYDPLWMNSAKLVELVAEKQQNNRSFDYGRLLTVSGKLMCMDQGLFNNLLKSPSIIDQIASGLDDINNARSAKVQKNEKRGIADIIREFVQSLPLGVIFILFSGSNAFWFNVKREYLNIQSLDIPLKFPLEIGGQWHVTGIIDALPQDYASIAESLGTFGEKRVVTQGIMLIAQMVVPLVGLFGRPADAIGLNPITIHREISI